MRTLNLMKNDLRFIVKYGIAFIYIAFTLLYLAILSMIRGGAREITAAILIYTDPAAMGLFFMGAFIILEKSQHVNCAIAVTPVTVREYIISKAVSLLVPGTIVGGILCFFAAPNSLLYAVPAIMFASALFSMCGLICAVRSKSLNGFMIAVIPFELIIFLPAILYVFGIIRSDLWLLHPGVAAIRLIMGNTEIWYGCMFSVLIWLLAIFVLCRKSVQRYFEEMGGGKIV
jgi:fluoroquinolone transport system permease protein